MVKSFFEVILLILSISVMGVGCADGAKLDDQDVDVEITEVNFYYFEQGEIKFTTEIISIANISDDTINFMKEYNGIQIDKIWYEGNRICVDLNESERAKLDAGSLSGEMITSILIKTFSSYPAVKEIELLIGGEQESFGNHFNFEKVFKVDEV